LTGVASWLDRLNRRTRCRTLKTVPPPSGLIVARP
jgi:hypothetical protein